MVKIRTSCKHGGAVSLSKKAGAWASYGVTLPHLFYSGIKLLDGSSVQFFVNRETGLVVLDHRHKGGRMGRELIRRKLDGGNIEQKMKRVCLPGSHFTVRERY